jgi:hypothetical protein
MSRPVVCSVLRIYDRQSSPQGDLLASSRNNPASNHRIVQYSYKTFASTRQDTCPSQNHSYWRPYIALLPDEHVSIRHVSKLPFIVEWDYQHSKH